MSNFYYTTKSISTIFKKDKFKEHYFYIISNLYIRRFIDNRYEKNSFIPLNYEMLITIVSKRYLRDFLDKLISLNIIEVGTKYSIGNHSNTYRINPEYLELEWIKVKYTDKLINKKLNMKSIKQYKDIKDLGNGYQTLYYYNNEIDIDVKKAKKFIKTTYGINNDTYNDCLFKISNFKNVQPVVDKTGNRFHSNITNLNSNLRQFLTWNTEKLEIIDIVNSQPLFLYILLKERGNCNIKELEKYKELVESGKFYDYFMNKFKIEDRKKIKEMVFSRLLFGKNYSTLTKEEEYFKIEFPTIFNDIREMKSNDHSILAITLQKIESNFIINKCVNQISKSHNYNIFLNTIHDAIVVTKDNKMEVKKQILEIFKSEYNLTPKLK